MTAKRLVVTYELDDEGQKTVTAALDGAGEVVVLTDQPPETRAGILAGAEVVLSRNTSKELADGELIHLANASLLQFVSAGIDFIPLANLPPSLPVAFNGGGYSEPMAEHGLTMALAAAKRLMIEHENLKRGTFNQFIPNRMLAGGIVGILGFGGIGVASAKLFRGLGMSVHAINRRGASDEPTDWIGKPADLDRMLSAADVLLVSLPLTRTTQEMIGAKELSLMKPDAILVNLARGEIINEAALYDHLRTHPKFTACIDAWWIEPVRHGEFRMDQPFLDLPNVIASPHNSASVKSWRPTALSRAVENCRRALLGEKPLYLVGPDDRFMD
ncbi:MAG: hydroxyacid dehydrogenase [Rhodospirillaceae bacterium]|nr:hydroxyacid dehydrogenase [Rhodospirillaceae bacterium]